MKKFTISYEYNGQSVPFVIYIGKPEPKHHPIHHQAQYCTNQLGGRISGEFMNALSKLQELSVKHQVPLEDLCVLTIGTEEHTESKKEGDDSTVDDSAEDENELEGDTEDETDDDTEDETDDKPEEDTENATKDENATGINDNATGNTTGNAAADIKDNAADKNNDSKGNT